MVLISAGEREESKAYLALERKIGEDNAESSHIDGEAVVEVYGWTDPEFQTTLKARCHFLFAIKRRVGYVTLNFWSLRANSNRHCT